jgi:hypothetical protein
MRSAAVLASLILLGWTGGRASAQGPGRSPGPAAPAIERSAKQTPAALFAKQLTLFEKVKLQLRQSTPHAVPAPKDRIVCGMKVLQADPSVDSKMILRAPATGVDMKIRRIEPPVCND